MSEIILRTMERADWAEVAQLIYVSTNAWYQQNRNAPIFTGAASECELFCRVYEHLDPGCCLLAIEESTGTIVGSCFFHPRSTHISVGIVNTHPDFFGKGIARRLMEHVLRLADEQKKPVRLISSAMNLDSFSLYTRLGFVPRRAYQDMFIPPEKVLALPYFPLSRSVRDATPADVPAMAALERELAGIERENDLRYFVKNKERIWGASVFIESDGSLSGFLISVSHPASTMLGPGVMRTNESASMLILAELRRRAGQSPVFLVPVHHPNLIRWLYECGARNCEIHFSQVYGVWTQPKGVVMPTFMPETG